MISDCPEYKSEDFSDQINGLDFHIIETFKNHLAGGCVTEFKTNISLPSNGKQIRIDTWKLMQTRRHL